jgi:transcriptional regulator with XRE-family HTH domain
MLREARGLTANAAAEAMVCSAMKISRIETAQRKASLRDVRDLCQLYEVGELETAHLMDLARSTREEGWWARYEDLGVGPYLGLEQEARAITYYSLNFVHGLLQTAGYAQAIIRTTHPLMDDQVLKERVEARIRRQELLEKTVRPRLEVLLDEAVLRRQVGGPEITAGQLNKIIDATMKEKAVVQIVPFYSAGHPGTESNLTLFEFGDSALSSIVHIETLLSSLTYDRPATIERYREVLDNLREVALSPRDSQGLITLIRDEHSTHP